MFSRKCDVNNSDVHFNIFELQNITKSYAGQAILLSLAKVWRYLGKAPFNEEAVRDQDL